MDATKSLKEHYEALISINGTRDFFSAFADYMDFIGSKPNLARIVKKISMQGDPLREKLKDASSKALNKISEIKNELAAYVAENKIEKPNDIKVAFLEYDNYFNSGAPHTLHDHLQDVVQMLYDMPRHKDFASRYIEFNNEKKERVNHFLPVRELDYYLEVRDDWAASQKTAFWATLDYLLTLYRIIRHADGKLKWWWEYNHEQLSDEAWLSTTRHQMMLAEWKAVEVSRRDKEKTFFVISDVMPMITQLQHHIITQRPQTHGKLASNGNDTWVSPQKREMPSGFAPKLIVDKITGMGFLKLFERGKKPIQVGRPKTRGYRLIECFLNPYGLPRRYDDVCNAIRLADKDRLNPRLGNLNTEEEAMRTIIKNTIRDLRRDKELGRYLKFEWQGVMLRMTLLKP